MRLTATTDIAPGAEILAVYGRGYSSKIVYAVREQRVAADLAADEIAPIVWSRGAVQRMQCAKCIKVLTKSNRLRFLIYFLLLFCAGAAARRSSCSFATANCAFH